MSDDLLEIKNLNKDFTDKTGYKVHLLENISLNIEKSKITSVLAPKGAGKSTLLKIIAGLLPVSGSNISEHGKSVIYIPSKASSFPWLDVETNITYNYESYSGTELKSIISLVGLEGYENHYPVNDSLGFRFRIALGRSLMRKPDIIIIDESFNEMLPETREDAYNLLLSVQRELNLALLVGTSKISEAVLLSDVIYLMDKNPGRIIERIENNIDAERSTKIIEDESFLKRRSEIEARIADVINHKFMDYSF